MNTLTINISKESINHRNSINLEFSKRLHYSNWNKLQTNFHIV
jgi:hypothetical protein